MKTLAFAVLLATALGYGIVSGYGLNIISGAAGMLLGSMIYDSAKYFRRRAQDLKEREAIAKSRREFETSLAGLREALGAPSMADIAKAWRDGTPTPGCNCDRCERIRAAQPEAQN